MENNRALRDITVLDLTRALMDFAVATGKKPLGYNLFKAMYDQGCYGKSVGHGFYDYE